MKISKCCGAELELVGNDDDDRFSYHCKKCIHWVCDEVDLDKQPDSKVCPKCKCSTDEDKEMYCIGNVAPELCPEEPPVKSAERCEHDKGEYFRDKIDGFFHRSLKDVTPLCPYCPKPEKKCEHEVNGGWRMDGAPFFTQGEGRETCPFCSDRRKPEARKGCGVCGGQLVLIRGRYPNHDKREVCPTCATERLEQIREISDKDYGKASTNG